MRRRPPVQKTQQSAVFSYHAARSPRDEDRQMLAAPGTSQTNKGKVRRMLASILAAVAILFVAGILLQVSDPVIAEPDDRQQQTFLRPLQTYEEAAAEFIENSALNRNKITFDAAGISEKMRSQFPELANVSIALPVFTGEPVVHVAAFIPVILLEADNGTYAIDKNGRAFSTAGLPANKKRALAEIPLVRDQTGTIVKERQSTLPAGQILFIQEIIWQLKAKDIFIDYMVLPSAPRQSELEVRIKDKSYTVRFDLYGDAREGVGRFLATKSYLEGRGEEPKDYIDARVPNRVFYR